MNQKIKTEEEFQDLLLDDESFVERVITKIFIYLIPILVVFFLILPWVIGVIVYIEWAILFIKWLLKW